MLEVSKPTAGSKVAGPVPSSSTIVPPDTLVLLVRLARLVVETGVGVVVLAK